MNSPERNIRILGIALLVGFTTTVTAVYWDLPGRLRATLSDTSAAPLAVPVDPSSPARAAAAAGQCPVYCGPIHDITPAAAAGQMEASGGCCAKGVVATLSRTAGEFSACDRDTGGAIAPTCEHSKSTPSADVDSTKPTAAATPANSSHGLRHE